MISPNSTIAIVANSAWNIKNFRFNLAKFLQKKNFNVIAVAPNGTHAKAIQKGGIPFIPLKHLSRKGTNPIKDLSLIQELRSIYSKENVALALCFTIKPNIYGSIAGNITNTKTISTVTGLGYSFLNKGFTNQITKRLYRYAFKKSDKVVFQNPDDRHEFISQKLAIEDRTEIIFGSGVDANYFLPEARTQETDKSAHFLFIGRLLYDKGIREFIQAIDQIQKQNHNASFEIIGDIDPENPSSLNEKDFKSWLINHPFVKYSGYSNNIKKNISNCDAIVLPSYREGLPKTVLEAMSMGKPAIVTDVPGCRETVVDGENGFLVKPYNSNSLAKGIIKMINLSNASKLEMGRKGRNLVLNKFDEKIIHQKYLKLINELD